jgi:hypothetical protein
MNTIVMRSSPTRHINFTVPDKLEEAYRRGSNLGLVPNGQGKYKEVISVS